jgi:copper transport protein
MLLKDRARTTPAGRSRHSRSIRAARSTRRRWILGLLGLVAACWGALVVTMPASSGDPALVSTSPSDTEVVTSPDEVRLTFDQPVSAELATVRMTKPNGDQVVHGRPHNPPGASDTIAVPMPDTRYAGTYSVAWSVPSSRLEPITGTFSFEVFSPSEPVHVPEIPNERNPVVATAHNVARLAAVAAFTLGTGLFLALAVARPAGSQHARVRRLITCALWVLVGGTLGTILSFGAYAARVSLADAFDPALVSGTLGSRIGAGLLARLLVLVPITIALVRLPTNRTTVTTLPRWSSAATGLACAAPLAATWSLARPRAPHGPTLLGVVAETALLLTLTVCVGGALLVRMQRRAG